MVHRNEFELLQEQGLSFQDPFEAVTLFEKKIANHFGAPYAVAVDCCTHALELSLRYLEAQGPIQVPRQTYLSVPMTVLKVGADISWTDAKWNEVYTLAPYPVIDGALSFKKDSYQVGTFLCLSFQQKKTLPIGRGGMILTSDADAAQWLQKASYDGRTRGRPWKNDPVDVMGYHYYMTPEDAARGLLLFNQLSTLEIKGGGFENYPDLSLLEVFKNHGR